MQNRILCTLCLFFFISSSTCSKTNKELTWNAEVNTIKDSQYLLKHQLSDSLYQAISDRRIKRSDRVIKTEKEAIEFAVPFFSKEFGEDYEIEERRFLGHLIKGFWIVKGLQPMASREGLW